MKKYFLFPACVLLAIILTGCFFNGGGFKQTKVNQNKADVAKTKEVSITDCGTSKAKAYADSEKDKTLVCLGKSMLNGCKNSKAILDMPEMGQVNVEVKKNGEKCVGIMKFGNKEQIKTKEYENFADKDIQCPLDIKLFDEQYRASTTGPKFSETPGWLAAAFYYRMIMQPMVYPETECTGSIFDSYSDYAEPIGMPTPEETLSYAAKAIEDGDIEEALKMFDAGAHDKMRDLLRLIDSTGRERLAESLRNATLDTKVEAPPADTLRTYKTEMFVEGLEGLPEGESSVSTHFIMITIRGGNWVIMNL